MTTRAASPRDLTGVRPVPFLPDPQVSIRLKSDVSPKSVTEGPLSLCFHCVTVSPSPEHPTRKRNCAEGDAKITYARKAGDTVTGEQVLKNGVISRRSASLGLAPCHPGRSGERAASQLWPCQLNTRVYTAALILPVATAPASARQCESAEPVSVARGGGEGGQPSCYPLVTRGDDRAAEIAQILRFFAIGERVTIRLEIGCTANRGGARLDRRQINDLMAAGPCIPQTTPRNSLADYAVAAKHGAPSPTRPALRPIAGGPALRPIAGGVGRVSRPALPARICRYALVPSGELCEIAKTEPRSKRMRVRDGINQRA
jgi:hypothetical protein